MYDNYYTEELYCMRDEKELKKKNHLIWLCFKSSAEEHNGLELWRERDADFKPQIEIKEKKRWKKVLLK